MLDEALAVAVRFVSNGHRGLVLELRQRGRGAELPFALVDGDGRRIDLTPRELDWLCAIAPRALQISREEA